MPDRYYRHKIGEELCRIKESKEYEKLGYTSWRKFIDRLSDISYTDADNLINYFKQHNRLFNLGVTKVYQKPRVISAISKLSDDELKNAWSICTLDVYAVISISSLTN